MSLNSPAVAVVQSVSDDGFTYRRVGEMTREEGALALAQLARQMARNHGFDAYQLMNQAAASLADQPMNETPLETLLRINRV